ncbi:hypothetical protein [Saccharospirillum salsuginis]|uniref:hypothetical protein n=1 Tax=Saccharospirillum salsuginis TaxID=418750 RepID=UPI00167B48B7|nr:hypothetical protein [Saccharospirillum salsuginis]
MKLKVFFCWLLLVGSGCAYSSSAASSQCDALDSWYQFSQQAFCFPKSAVTKLAHLNQSEPSASVLLQPGGDGTPFELGIFWEPEDGAIGRLSRHLGLSVEELFTRLAASDFSEDDASLVSKVLWLDASEKVDVQQSGDLRIVSILRSGGAHSSVYVQAPSRPGLIYLAGELDERQIEWVVRHIDVGPVP